jgi:phage host-nuclease inhibitor protein Gam
MSKPKVVKKVLIVGSRADAEVMMGELAAITAQKRLGEGLLELALQSARDEFGPAILTAEQAIEAMEVALELWAEANEGEFPAGKRSLELTHGTIGFRKAPPSLEVRSGLNWKKALLRVEAFMDGFYVRQTPSVDKEAILKDEAAGTLTPQKWAEMGVKVLRPDNFYADPKAT